MRTAAKLICLHTGGYKQNILVMEKKGKKREKKGRDPALSPPSKEFGFKHSV